MLIEYYTGNFSIYSQIKCLPNKIYSELHFVIPFTPDEKSDKGLDAW